MVRTRRRSIAAPRRKRVWARDTFSEEVLAGGSEQRNLLTSYLFEAGLTAPPPGLTIGRVRLTVGWETTSTPATSDAIFLGLVVRHTGSTDALSPRTDRHADWMYWSKRMPQLESPRVAGQLAWDIDIKAQRRMEELGQGLFFVIEAQPLVAGMFFLGASTLLVLP